jgi:hypothetical protein
VAKAANKSPDSLHGSQGRGDQKAAVYLAGLQPLCEAFCDSTAVSIAVEVATGDRAVLYRPDRLKKSNIGI